MLAEIGHCPPPFALRDQNDQNATPLEDEVMGDPVLLVFDCNPSGSKSEDSAGLLHALVDLHDRLNGVTVTIFVISRRSTQENAQLAQPGNLPFRLLSDEFGRVFKDYGIDPAATTGPASIVLDPNGRVVQICERLDPAEQVEKVLASLQELDAQRPRGSLGVHPPVLVVPNAMDPRTCERLIETWHRPVPLWEGDGKVSAGFDIEDGDFKVWSPTYGNVVQYVVRDPDLTRELDNEVMSRIVPQLDKAFGYRPTKREEYRIACYDAAEGGNLAAHRDNPTEATRHRRFTVSVNLNNSAYEGGELAFRESSEHRYNVAEGTAIVWSCSLLHEVMPITAGRRFILGNHLYG